jgi:hypothetical protein
VNYSENGIIREEWTVVRFELGELWTPLGDSHKSCIRETIPADIKLGQVVAGARYSDHGSVCERIAHLQVEPGQARAAQGNRFNAVVGQFLTPGHVEGCKVGTTLSYRHKSVVGKLRT